MSQQNFRYTRNNTILTLKQRIFYEKNGYLVFPRLISQNDLDRYYKRFYDIIEGRVSRDRITVMYDVKDRKSVNKLQDINFDPVLFEYLEHKKILDIAECFTGPNILSIHNMLIAKPPDSGFNTSRHPPHQDLYYFPLRPADRIVAAWTAIEHCDKENGCLFVAPGSHTGSLRAHDYPSGPNNKFYHGVQDMPNTTYWQDLEMEPGDTVFFHPLIVHGSGVNKSKRSRLAISGHYAAAECHYELEPIQRHIESEIIGYANKKYPGIEMTYKDLWNIKTTLVRGIKSSL